MKIIEVIAEASLGNSVDDAFTGARNIGTSVLRGIGNVFGRGSRFRKAEELAPEIEALARTKGRPLTRDEIAKHISNSHPGVADEIADAVKTKQDQLDHDYQRALDAWNRKPVRSRTAATKPQPAPAARLTSAEETAIRSKPEYQPDPKLVNDVESKANKLKSKADQAEAIKNLAPVAKWADKLVRYGVETAIAAQVVAPFAEYYAKVERAKEYYDAGQMPNAKDMPKDVKTLADWYIWYTDQALGDAILKSGGIFAAAYVARKTFRWLGGIAKVFAGDTVGTYLGNLSGSAFTAIFISWGFDEDMDKYWGSVLANLIDIPVFHLNLSRVVGGAVNSRTSAGTQELSSDIMWTVSAIAEKFRQLVGLTNGSDAFVDKSNGKTTSPTVAGQPAAAGTVTTPAADAPAQPAAAGTVTTPAAGNADKKAAQQGFTDLGGGWLEDPKTGKIYPKIQESR